MNTNPANSSFAVIRRRIAKAGVFFIASVMAYGAYTDYVGTLTNRIILDAETFVGYGNGDIVSFIAESTPDYTGSEVGAGAWNTIYIPVGVRVVGVQIVQADGDGTYSPIPTSDIADIADGCGNRGCNFPTTGLIQDGKLNENQQDTGIFYSTDSRTQLLAFPNSISPTGTKVKPQEVWNDWDHEQLKAFGGGPELAANGGNGNTPVVDTGSGWAGTGSPVAGPQTYFTNDYNPVTCPGSSNNEIFDAEDLQCNGPWSRIQYANAKYGGSGAVAPTTIDPGIIQNTSVPPPIGLEGIVVDASNPLDAATNAVRYVLGRRRIGELETVRITFRVTDSTAFTNSLTSGDSFCFDATGGDADKPGRGPQDNIWRYYEGNNHTCFQGSVSANFYKVTTFVDGAPAPGSANPGSVISYELEILNTGTMPIRNINITDTPASADLLILAEGANPLCQYPSYDGDYVGGLPAFSSIIGNTASWDEFNPAGGLLPGEKLKVFLCTQIDPGANFGDAFDNDAQVTFTFDGATLEPPLNSTAVVVISNIIAGTVYLDNDNSGSETAGDTGIDGVVIELYTDVNSNGIVDGTDTLIDSAFTNGTGAYAFIGQDPGDYVVKEVGLTGLKDTADADNPLGTCDTGNFCNTIGTTLTATGFSSKNDFFNLGAKIGDLVYNDADGSGTFTTGDAGIDGVTTDLYNDVNGNGAIDIGDILLSTQTTAGGGAYDFIGLDDGMYIVDITDTGNMLTGSVNTTSNDPLAVTVAKGENFDDADFGYFQPQADLEIVKTDGATEFAPGAEVTYTITVTNNNITTSSPADGATVADSFAAPITSASWTCVGDGSAICPNATGSGDINEVIATFPSGSVLVYTVTAQTDPAATIDLVNTATVTVPSGVGDPAPGNNTSTDTDTAAPEANLFITKDDSSATYTPGGSGTYIIVVGNNGPSNVTGATVSDTFPPGVTLSAAVTCVATNTASCTAGIGALGATSFSDAAVNINADVDGVDNVNGPGDSYVTYTVPVTFSLNPGDY